MSENNSEATKPLENGTSNLKNGECLELMKKRSRSRRGGSESEAASDVAIYSLGMAEQILRASPERARPKVNFSVHQTNLSEEPSATREDKTGTSMVSLVEDNLPKKGTQCSGETRLYASQSASSFAVGGSNRGRTTSCSSDLSPVLTRPERNHMGQQQQQQQLQQQQQQKTKEFAKKRSRSLCAPNPKFDFGPKGSIMKSSLGLTTIQDPSTLRLNWDEPPEAVLVMKKQFDNSIVPHFKQLLHFLVAEKKLTVFVEESVVEENLGQDPSFEGIKDQISIFSSSVDMSNKIDLIICMGGDGTLLHANSIFQNSVPPILSFHLGSLGFLMPFDFSNFRSDINRTMAGDVPLILRARLKGVIMKRQPEQPPQQQQDQQEGQQQQQQEQQQPPTRESSPRQPEQQLDSPIHKKMSSAKTNGLMRKSNVDETDEEESLKADIPAFDRSLSSVSSSFSASPSVSCKSFLVLNEIVIDRGLSAFISNVDLYLNGKLITRVQGDGLIISTPTGSTAYALAAGSSMVHPSVQSILITPICPHSLSFRPISVPAGVELKVMLSPEARHSAWVSFDGRNRQELSHGDVLRVTTSVHPVPSVARNDQLQDWFDSLADCLHWNVRQPQKSLDWRGGLPSSVSSSSLESMNNSQQ